MNILKTTFLALLVSSSAQADQLYKLDYNGFKITYNCDRKGADYVEYETKPDTGNLPRAEHFHQEKRLPKECRQKSTGTYKRKVKSKTKDRHDRGHLIPANHFDFSKRLIKETNTMANILPQNATLNRTGLWRMTDKIVECSRDKGSYVYGGVVWGDNENNDYYLKSHGVETPDYFYKIIINSNGEHQAWLMENTHKPTVKSRDDYLVSVEELERLTGHTFEKVKNKKYKAKKSWHPPKKCDLS